MYVKPDMEEDIKSLPLIMRALQEAQICIARLSVALYFFHKILQRRHLDLPTCLSNLIGLPASAFTIVRKDATN